MTDHGPSVVPQEQIADLIHRLRSRAMIEAPQDNDGYDPDQDADDSAEITWGELAEIAALLREAADALAASASSSTVRPPQEALEQLIATWRQPVTQTSHDPDYDNGRESARNRCADELETTLRADAAAASPQNAEAQKKPCDRWNWWNHAPLVGSERCMTCGFLRSEHAVETKRKRRGRASVSESGEPVSPADLQVGGGDESQHEATTQGGTQQGDGAEGQGMSGVSAARDLSANRLRSSDGATASESVPLLQSGVVTAAQTTPPPQTEESQDMVCRHGTAMDVHCCNCHSGFIFDPEHKCPPPQVALDWQNLRNVLCCVSQIFNGWRGCEEWSKFDEETAQAVVEIQRAIDVPVVAQPTPAPKPDILKALIEKWRDEATTRRALADAVKKYCRGCAAGDLISPKCETCGHGENKHRRIFDPEAEPPRHFGFCDECKRKGEKYPTTHHDFAPSVDPSPAAERT